MKHIAKIVLAGALVLTSGTLAFAGDSNAERIVPEVKAYRVNPHAPVIDGNLEDPVWSSSEVDLISHFTQTDPDEGANVTESTLVAVAYDEKALYVAFWCYDSEPDKVARQLVRRDRWSQSDQISLRLDPYHDHKSGYMFTVSAAGTQRDQSVANDGHTDGSWDAVWSSAVQEQPWGWSAEIEIPYHCLRFTEQASHTWGIEFVRVVNRKNEWSRWAYTPSSEGGFVSNFGHLTGLENIVPARHLEIMPYVVSSFETETKSEGNSDGRSLLGNTGVDIKYGLTSNLTLDATINPDFGQVEADRPVLNLSSYETWFPEKRPFFVEGADLWRSEYRMFYSRRIGRAPSGSVDDDQLLYYTDYPSAATILGATKLTGKLGSGTSIAFLGAVTDEEMAKYAALDSVYNQVYDADSNVVAADSSISYREGMVEPMAGYSVLRIKQDVFDQSSIGAIMTVTSQDTYHPAVTGGFDWRLRTNDNRWGFRGQTIFSRVDPEHVGFATDMVLEKTSGEHVRGAVGLVIKDPHLEINRLGMTGRNDTRHAWFWAQYRTQDDWWIVRNSYNNINGWIEYNYAGDEIEKGANFNNYVEFTNNWWFNSYFAVQAEKYTDREIWDQRRWEWPVVPTWAVSMSFGSDERKNLSFNVGPSGGTDRGGDRWGINAGIEYRPASNMEFYVSGNYSRSFNATRHVDNLTVRYDTTFVGVDTVVNEVEIDEDLFADLDQDSFRLNATASIMAHKNLSFQLSASGFISGLDYQQYRPYLDNNLYGPTQNDRHNYDYNWSSINSTMLVRWEYRPGSSLYLVWTRSRPDYDDSVNNLDLGRDFDRFFSAGSTNVFLVKASYWLNI